MQPLDYAMIAAYLGAVFWLARRATSGARNEEAFFLGGRRFGKMYQFFFNFGNTTEANTAVSTVSFVYRDGASGAWLPLQMVFLNPYYWFMNVWFRRVRLMTMAELFETRLGSPGLAVFYALFQIGVAIMGIGFSNFIAYKILAALVPGLTPLEFYPAYVAVIALYVAMGGLVATVTVQVFQGILVLAFSIMLLPAGWRALDAGALRDRLPQRMFDLFGAPGREEYTWYAVLALLAVSIVQINGTVVNMGLGGSARNEFAARFGAVAGTFGKRLMVVFCAFLGLIAASLFRGSGRLSDPDMAWGALSLRLLGPGFLGMMLAGVFAANMPSSASKAMAVSALVVRNLCRPFVSRMGDARAVLLGRIAIAVALAGSVAAALVMRQALTVTKLIITINLPFGAATLLMFFWRRLTRAAVWACVLISFPMIFVAPFAAQEVPALAATASPFFDSVEGAGRPGQADPPVGRGRFNLEAWTLDRAGIPMRGASRGGLLAAQFFFDAVFPFAILIGVSLLTRPPPGAEVDRFFGIMKTPVGATPELEAAAVGETMRNPRRFDHLKVFPGSAWEFTVWDRTDTAGFFACCAISAAIVGLFWLALGRVR